MAEGRNIQLTKQIGEYLVCAELGRRGFISTTFTGNVPNFDIIAISEKMKAIFIQVKTINGGTWQFNAKRYLKIKISGGIQKIIGKRPLIYSEIVYVFVNLKGTQKDEFYICKEKDVQEIVYSKYKAMLERCRGKRPTNPNSTHTTIKPIDLRNYENNWQLIGC